MTTWPPMNSYRTNEPRRVVKAPFLVGFTYSLMGFPNMSSPHRTGYSAMLTSTVISSANSRSVMCISWLGWILLLINVLLLVHSLAPLSRTVKRGQPCLILVLNVKSMDSLRTLTPVNERYKLFSYSIKWNNGLDSKTAPKVIKQLHCGAPPFGMLERFDPHNRWHGEILFSSGKCVDLLPQGHGLTTTHQKSLK